MLIGVARSGSADPPPLQRKVKVLLEKLNFMIEQTKKFKIFLPSLASPVDRGPTFRRTTVRQ